VPTLGRSTPQKELASLIEAVFSDVKVVDIVQSLQESNVQKFIDAMDKVCDTPFLRKSFVANCRRLGPG
jgi:hypothetical protein